jgi:hypothetical protein
VVVVVLIDADTLGDCVTRVLALCDTDTVDVFEVVWLSVGGELSEYAVDEDTDGLDDSDSELKLVIDGSELTEILTVIDELPDTEVEAVSL